MLVPTFWPRFVVDACALRETLSNGVVFADGDTIYDDDGDGQP